MYAWQHQRPEEDVVISDVCELPSWCWKLDLAPPEEKQVFLISPAQIFKYKRKQNNKNKKETYKV